jgi:chondroitin AC lyase
VPFLKELSPGVAGELQLIADVQSHKRLLQDFRHFPYVDFTVYHTPGYSFFLKTISVRTLPTVSINQENLLGKWLGTGDSNLISNGNEYHNMMPVFDWNALPGTISFPSTASLRRSSFSGSVGDEQSGITVMDTRIWSVDSINRLNLRRLWAMNDGIVVQLVTAADSSAGVDSFRIAIEQSRLQSAVTVNERPNLQANGKPNVSSVASLSHNNITYRFDKPVERNDLSWPGVR